MKKPYRVIYRDGTDGRNKTELFYGENKDEVSHKFDSKYWYDVHCIQLIEETEVREYTLEWIGGDVEETPMGDDRLGRVVLLNNAYGYEDGEVLKAYRDCADGCCWTVIGDSDD